MVCWMSSSGKEKGPVRGPWIPCGYSEMVGLTKALAKPVARASQRQPEHRQSGRFRHRAAARRAAAGSRNTAGAGESPFSERRSVGEVDVLDVRLGQAVGNVEHELHGPFDQGNAVEPAITATGDPAIGFEAEGRSSSSPVYRATFGVQTELYPAPDRINYRIQLTGDYRYRRGTREEGGHADHPSFAADVNIYLLGASDPEAGSPVAGVGVGYVMADNPAEEMARQQFGRLVFRLKF